MRITLERALADAPLGAKGSEFDPRDETHNEHDDAGFPSLMISLVRIRYWRNVRKYVACDPSSWNERKGEKHSHRTCDLSGFGCFPLAACSTTGLFNATSPGLLFSNSLGGRKQSILYQPCSFFRDAYSSTPAKTLINHDREVLGLSSSRHGNISGQKAGIGDSRPRNSQRRLRPAVRSYSGELEHSPRKQG